jgi:PST family polysaccharide transporter
MMRLSARVMRAMRWDILGSTAVAALTFLTTVWLARALAPETYGLLALLLATVSLGQLLANGGVRTALLRFVPEAVKRGGPAAAVTMIVDGLWLRTAILVAVSVPLVFLPRLTAGALGRPALAPYMPWMPLLIALPMYADVLAAALLSVFRQRTLRLSEVANKLVYAACLLAVPLWADAIHGVILAWTLGWLAAIGWLAVDAGRVGFLARAARRRHHDLRRLVRFVGTAYGLSLIAFVLGRELDLLLLARFGVGDDMIAQYTIAFAFVTLVYRLPLLPIAGGFDQPLIAGLYAQHDWPALRRLFRAYFEYICLFIVPIMAGGAVLGSDLVREIYGVPYGSAPTLIVALLVALGLAKLAGITGPFMLGTDRETAMLRIRSSFAAVNVLAALAAIPIWGATGAVLATSLTMIGLTAAEAVFVDRYLGAGYPRRFLVSIAIGTAAMAAVVAGLRSLAGEEPGLIPLLGIVAAGAGVYLALLLWLRPVDHRQAEILAGAGAPSLARIVARISQPAAASS